MMAIVAAAACLISPFTITRALPRVLRPDCYFRRSSALPAKSGRNISLFTAALVQNLKPSHRTSFIASAMVAVGTAPASNSPVQHQQLDEFAATELGYFADMFALQSPATFLGLLTEGNRLAVIVDRTILYPQGGGQPFDTGSISALDENVKFRVEDVRAKNGIVYHYGNFESSRETPFQKGQEVLLRVDSSRRAQNSRLHSAGHLLDACMKSIGLMSLEPGKGHHFPDGPFVEYKGTIPATEIESNRAQLEAEANRLVTIGGPIQAVVAPYAEAADLCGGSLPAYIAKESTPRIVTVGGLGCPCGGTHVANVSEIGSIKVSQIRVKKGLTKVSYTITPDSK